MNTIEVNYQVAPTVQMPEPLQTILFCLLGGLSVIMLIYAVIASKKYNNFLPVLFVFAGFATSILEAPACNLGHIVHAQLGQMVLYETLNRPIPWHLAFMYTVFFPGIYMVIYSKFTSASLTKGFLWKLYIITMVLNFVGEIYPVHKGAWVYYDPQALLVWKDTQPLFYTFLNAGCAILPATIIMHYLPKLKGWKQLWVIVISPVGAVMAHMGCGILFYNATNSTWGNFAVQLCGLASIIFSIIMVKLCFEHLLEHQKVSLA